MKLFIWRLGLVSVTRLLLSFSGLILLPILSKNLTLDDYGSWALFQTTLSMVSAFIMLSLDLAMVRFIPASKDKGSVALTTISTVLLIAIAVSVILYLVKGLTAKLLGSETLVTYLVILIPINCVSSMLLGYFTATLKIKLFSGLLIAQTALDVILISVFIKYGIKGPAIALIISRVTLTIISLTLIMKDLHFKIPKFRNIRTYLKYSLPLASTRITSWVIQQSDRYFINFYLSPASVGIYNPGYSLGNTVYTFAAPIEILITPTIAKFHDERNLKEVKKYLTHSLRLYLFFSIPATFGLSILSKRLLLSLSTPEIASKGWPIACIMAFTMLLFGVAMIAEQPLILEKKTKVVAIAWLIALVVNVVLNFALIPRFGVIGAALTAMFAFTTVAGITAVWGYKLIPFDLNLTFVCKSVMISSIMSAVVWFGGLNTWLSILMGFIVYIVLMVVCKAITKADINVLKEVVKR